MVIADEKNVLAIAGVKGGKIAEVDNNTKNILIEIANFDPVSVRKTSKKLGILTDSSKRFENDLSAELTSYAMRELSALILEMYSEATFEEIVDVYPNKQKPRTLSFSAGKISKILGVAVSVDEIKDILRRYNIEYKNTGDKFEITIPFLRLDLTIEEDMAEEIGRVLGYDKIKPKIPSIDLPRLGKAGFTPKENEVYSKINWARNKLLNDGYSEVMTYVFRDKGEVEVLASASDKKFLRTNLTDGLKESLKLNQLNAPLLEMNEIKIFEIGTVWCPGEETHVAYADKKEVKEMSLEKFCISLITPVVNPTGPVSVMLAINNPATRSVVTTEAGVDFMHLTFTGVGIITNITLKHIGTSADTSLLNVYIYDGTTRLTDAVLISNNDLAIFNSHNGLFTVNGSRTISVKVEMNGTAGETVGLALISYTTLGQTIVMLGAPLSGNLMIVADATLATVSFSTVTPATNTSLTPGKNIIVWQGVASVMTRDIKLSYFTIREIGSIAKTDLSNIRLLIDNDIITEMTTNPDSNGYVTFVPTSPLTLKTGSHVFKIMVDVLGSGSYQFFVEKRIDIGLIDSKYNVSFLTSTAINSLSGFQQTIFKMWPLFPFIVRDIAVWVPEGVESENVEKIIKDNMGKLVTRGPELFDEFKKESKTSYAFRLVFQSHERTLTDSEVNEIMEKITGKIKEKNGWQVR